MDISLEDRCSVILKFFTRAYFGHVAPTSPIWSDLQSLCAKYLASAAQKGQLEKWRSLLETSLIRVVEHHPLIRFPVSNKLRLEAGHWIKLVVDGQIDAFNPGPRTLEEPEYIFKSFDLGSEPEDYLTLLEENREIIGHGTTGLTSWQGAVFLSEWLIKCNPLTQESRVLELGSGSGFLGLSLLKAIPMESFVFTDCHSKVINALINNLQLNFPPTTTVIDLDAQDLVEQTRLGPNEFIAEDKIRSVSYHQTIRDCSVSIQRLDWLQHDAAKLPKVDVVLGSDIVYERTFLPPLCDLIRTLLKTSDSPNPVAFVACTERSFTTLECFNGELKRHALDFAIVSKGQYSPTETILSSDVHHQATRIYQIQLAEGVSPSERGVC